VRNYQKQLRHNSYLNRFKAEAEVKRLDQLKASKMKELFFKKQSELEQICNKSHMEIPSQPGMENIINLINSGKIDRICLSYQFPDLIHV
jgi:protein regulator of cytokinesis 1